LHLAGAVAGQVEAQPGVVTQLADLDRRDERGPQHAALVELGQPHRIELVRFGPAGDMLHVAGVHQPHRQAPRVQQVVERPPVVRCGFEHHSLDALLSQLAGQRDDRVRPRRDAPHARVPLARLGLVRHPYAHHAGVLGHVNRRDPLKDLLLARIGIDQLIDQVHHPPTSTSADGAGHPRVRWGTEI
jgi:hypothetical protein